MTSDANPVLLVLRRGSAVESWHRGAIAVVAGPDSGRSAWAVGATDRPVLFRSVAKPFQLLAGLNAGMASVADPPFDADELAVMAASHNAEPDHVEVVSRLLARGGFDVADLRCGTHPSLRLAVTETMARSGVTPTAIHNNCSGKHAGMLLHCRAIDADPATYLDPEHPVQTGIRDALARVLGVLSESLAPVMDGCSAPTFAVPLWAVADAFRKLANPSTAAAPEDRDGLTSIRDAMASAPFFVAGTDRLDTDLMTAGRGRLVAKIGAEGLVACGVAGADVGVAISIDDGASRGYEPVLLAVLDRLGVLDDDARSVLDRYLDPVLRNHVGREVGRCEVMTDELSAGATA